jgi:hypothetical protein
MNGSGRKRAAIGIRAIVSVCLLAGAGLIWIARPGVNWPDRRPIGALFVASNFHSSTTNPRGWFNNPRLDVRGTEGMARFRSAMLEYADRSIANLKRTGSQGMIVWDLEGQEYPHKTTYIGDPRLVARLAPEAEPVVDEFFARFKRAGFATGVTIRPQQVSFDAAGKPTQENVSNYEQVLLDKIDYARQRWGATLFYIDSNGGPLWPAEVFHLRHIAQLRPQVLLIPEHHYFLYYGVGAPYGMVVNGASATSAMAHWLFPKSFQVLAVGNVPRQEDELAAAYRGGDILLFPAWYWDRVSSLIEKIAGHSDPPTGTVGTRPPG